MSHITPKRENICAVIVTYKPPSDVIKEIKVLMKQVDAIAIIDNGSDNISLLRQAARGDKITLIKNNENLGQGKALNQGAQWAIKHHYKWILLMDHDSLPKEDMVAGQITAYHEAVRWGIFSDLIGVNSTDKKTGRKAYKECDGRDFFQLSGCIKISGTLLSLNTYKAAGPFREDFFIDYIDSEYCLRLRNKKFHFIIACKANMLHELGKEGKSKYTANYPPWRRYYRTRNELVLLREYGIRQPWWAIKHIGWSLLIEWPRILSTEDQRIKKIYYACKGLRDACFGDMGKKTFNF